MIKSMIGSIIAKKMAKKVQNSTINEEDIQEVLKEIRISLLDADVNLSVIKKFINNIKEKTIGKVLENNMSPSTFVLNVVKEELINILGKNEKHINHNKKMTKIMLVGLQGSGKTTTSGKIANFYRSKHNKKPLLVACDIYRPAAIEQLRQLAEDSKIDFFEKQQINPSIIAKEALHFAEENENDFIIVDTAGRLQTNTELMEELIEVKKALNPDEIIMVVDGMSGQDIINVGKEFHEWLNLSGLIITKLDSNAKAGASLSLTALLEIPIKFIGTGEKSGSLELFYPNRMADRILGLGDVMTLAEKASEQIDEKEAKGLLNKLMSGKFDLEDMMKNMERLNNMGPLSGLMNMLPGKVKMNEESLQGVEDKMKIWKILLSSMTKKERRDPRLFKKQPNRKVRVVKGSGRKMDELNKLLKQWEEGKNKMAEITKMFKQGKNPFKGL